MKDYTLELISGQTTDFTISLNGSALMAAEFEALFFTNGGSAQFTPDTTASAVTIWDSPNMAGNSISTTEAVTAGVAYEGEWSAGATPTNTFSSFTKAKGVTMTKHQITDLMGKIKDAQSIRVLTRADYNFPASNPQGVALWLLGPGLYRVEDRNSTRVYATGNSAGTTGYQAFGDTFLVFKSTSFYNAYQILAMGQDGTTLNGGVEANFGLYQVYMNNGVPASGDYYAPRDALLYGRAVQNNLTTGDSYRYQPLAAPQGRILNETKLSKANLLAGDGISLTNAGTGASETITVSYKHLDGAGAPTSATAGDYVGQLYLDTTNDEMYYLASIDSTVTPATYSWSALGGSSINVAQATGTSTTDVMSQNAVTSLIWSDPATKKRISIGASSSIYNNSIGIGGYSHAQNYGVAIGAAESASDRAAASAYSVAIGAKAKANQSNTIAIGYEASADSHGYGTAIGNGASAQGQASMALGSSATTGYNANCGVALGLRAAANGRGSVALGSNSTANAQGEINVGASSTDYGYNSTNYRLISGVHDPQSAHDAATKGYVDSNSASAFTTNEWNALWA